MFIGEYKHTIDDKGRLAIPAKFRDDVARGAVITRGLDTCLFVYTLPQWELLAAKLSALPVSQANARAFSRLMLAGAMDVEADKQGRIVIPEYLRTYAGLGKSVVIAGLYNRLELWDEQAWMTYTTQSEQESGDIAERLTELGI